MRNLDISVNRENVGNFVKRMICGEEVRREKVLEIGCMFGLNAPRARVQISLFFRSARRR